MNSKTIFVFMLGLFLCCSKEQAEIRPEESEIGRIVESYKQLKEKSEKDGMAEKLNSLRNFEPQTLADIRMLNKMQAEGELRDAAMKSLEKVRNPNLVGCLKEVLKEGNGYFKWSAVAALGTMSHEKLINSETDRQLNKMLLKMLEHVKAGEYSDAEIPQRLKNEEEYYLFQAEMVTAGVLAEMRVKKALPLIVERIEKNSQFRGIGQRSLVLFGKDGLAAAVKLLKSEKLDNQKRGIVLVTISLMEDRETLPDLEKLVKEDAEIAPAAAVAVRKLGGKVDVSKLIENLERNRPGVDADFFQEMRRVEAMTTLGEIKNEEALPFLEKELLGNDLVYSCAAITALLKIGSNRTNEIIKIYYNNMKYLAGRSDKFDCLIRAISENPSEALADILVETMEREDVPSDHTAKALRSFSAQGLYKLTGEPLFNELVQKIREDSVIDLKGRKEHFERELPEKYKDLYKKGGKRQ